MRWCFFGGLMAGMLSGIALQELTFNKQTTPPQVRFETKADKQ